MIVQRSTAFFRKSKNAGCAETGRSEPGKATVRASFLTTQDFSGMNEILCGLNNPREPTQTASAGKLRPSVVAFIKTFYSTGLGKLMAVYITCGKTDYLSVTRMHTRKETSRSHINE